MPTSQIVGIIGSGVYFPKKKITVKELAREIEVGDRTMTLGQRLFGFYFHETYHTGQTEALRQLAGTDDQVI